MSSGEPGSALYASLTIGPDSSVRAALEHIEAGGRGVVFVVDLSGKLLGAVSDGDIRRRLLASEADMDTALAAVLNPSPQTLRDDDSADSTFRTLRTSSREGKRILPRVSANGEVVGFSCLDDWGILPMANPEFPGNEATYVLECVTSGWISSTSPMVAEFEQKFGEKTGLANPLSCSNGTVAITLALQALGLQRDQEVIVPSCTFAATANAVIGAGGVPVFADVDSTTWGLSPETVAPLISSNTWGVIAVHLYGAPCDVIGLRGLCDEWGLHLVEDCAEAIGTTIEGRQVGFIGDAATFSFFGNKTITTGEGGMVTFRDPSAEKHAAKIRSHGMSSSRKYWHDVVGFNFRLTGLQAAVGLAQLEQLESLVSQKVATGSLFASLVSASRPDLDTGASREFGGPSYWLSTVLFDGGPSVRDEVMVKLARHGIESRPVFPPLHEMPPFRDLRRASTMDQSLRLADQGLCLPNYPGLSPDQVTVMVQHLLDAADIATKKTRSLE
jgi:perosamine synthetase